MCQIWIEIMPLPCPIFFFFCHSHTLSGGGAGAGAGAGAGGGKIKVWTRSGEAFPVLASRHFFHGRGASPFSLSLSLSLYNGFCVVVCFLCYCCCWQQQNIDLSAALSAVRTSARMRSRRGRPNDQGVGWVGAWAHPTGTLGHNRPFVDAG